MPRHRGQPCHLLARRRSESVGQAQMHSFKVLVQTLSAMLADSTVETDKDAHHIHDGGAASFRKELCEHKGPFLFAAEAAGKTESLHVLAWSESIRRPTRSGVLGFVTCLENARPDAALPCKLRARPCTTRQSMDRCRRLSATAEYCGCARPTPP